MKYIISLLLVLSCSLYAEEYLLKNRTHQIKIIPATMEIKIKTGNSNWETVSASQKRKKVEITKNSSNGVTWFSRELKSTFSVSLNNNRVDLSINNPDRKQIVWPRIESSNRTEALIWPASGGLWLPFRSSKGVDFFKRNELPLNSNYFWGINLKNRTLTYIQESDIRPFHYRSQGSTIIEFFQNESSVNISVILTNSPSPIEPALKYKEYLKNNNRLNNTLPKELLGSPVIYMKGKEYITADDLKMDRLRDFCRKVVAESRLVTSPSFKLKRAILAMKEWAYIKDGAKDNFPGTEQAERVARGLSRVISAPNFHSDSIKENSIFLYNSFKEYLYPVDTWGSGESLGVLTRLKELKIEKGIVLTEHTMSDEMKNHISALGYVSGNNKKIKGLPNKYGTETTLDRSLQLPLLNAVYRENYLTVSAYSRVNNSKTDILKQLLYMQPPLFPMDSSSGRDEHIIISDNYDLFSALHLRFGASPMLGFDYLSGSGLIQKATYQGGLTIVANFSKIECTYIDSSIPPESILIRTPEETIIF